MNSDIIKEFDSKEHLGFRNSRQSSINKNNKKLLGLTTVEVNPTELCNRTCSFCPRHDPALYPNQNLNMHVSTAKILVDQLCQADFQGDIHITGYGEPLLNPDILELIKCFSSEFHTEMITNGDRLSNGYYSVSQLEDAGLDSLIVDCYDGPAQIYNTTELLSECKIPYRIRNHHDTGQKHIVEMYQFNNRGGILGLTQPVHRPCWLPMYKAFVDWDGTVRLCCNDWARKHPDFGNIHQQDFSSIWMSQTFAQTRHLLLAGQRNQMPSCKSCDTHGCLQGQDSAKLWQESL